MQLHRLAVPVLVLAAFFAGTMVNAGLAKPASVVQQAAAQQQPAVFVIDYMKVPQGGTAAYEALERDIWKRVHAERQRQGLATSWALYRVRFPQGSAREYDYITINSYNSIADIDRGFTRDLIARAVPDVPVEEISRRTAASRNLVRGDVVYLVDRLP